MLNSFSSSLLIASIALVVGMTLMVLASPADVAAQSEPTPKAYLTVVVTDGDDTVSWSDPGNCSSDYNIYLAESPRHNTPETPPTHLGSAASVLPEATLAIPGSGQALNVKLYCGAYDAESSENGLIASTRVSRSGRMRQGTYSSTAMTALSISSGTLSPVFDRGIFQYAVEVQSDVEAITLNPTVLTGYETDFLKNPGWGVISTCDWFGNYCTYSYSSDGVLSDADTDAEGFQVNLNRGENRIGIGVNKGSIGIFAGTIRLTVTVQNATATGQPTISGTAQVQLLYLLMSRTAKRLLSEGQHGIHCFRTICPCAASDGGGLPGQLERSPGALRGVTGCSTIGPAQLRQLRRPGQYGSLGRFGVIGVSRPPQPGKHRNLRSRWGMSPIAAAYRRSRNGASTKLSRRVFRRRVITNSPVRTIPSVCRRSRPATPGPPIRRLHFPDCCGATPLHSVPKRLFRHKARCISGTSALE